VVVAKKIKFATFFALKLLYQMKRACFANSGLDSVTFLKKG